MSKPEDTLREELADLVEEHFPKGKCKERGQAMVLVAYAVMLFEAKQRALLETVEERLPKGCEWCDYKGYTETGGMAMEDDLVERQHCEYCYDVLAQAHKALNNLKSELGES